MSKFDSIFSSLYEEVAGASSTTTTPPSTSSVTANTPATNTPATFDQQHVQALAGISNVQGIQDYLKKNNLQLTPVQPSTSSQVTPTPNAA
jgi:hypothetical protein